MKYPIPHAGAIAALLLGAFASTTNASGQNKPLFDPADANAPVPPTRYVPRLSAPLASTSTLSPADNWKALNQTVASYDSMALTMDMPEPKPAERAPAEPSAPATGMNPTPAPHVGHSAAPATPPDPHSHRQQKEAK